MDDLLKDAEPLITVHDAIAEVERELAVRAKVFPRWIEAGRLKESAARLQIARLEMALEILREVAEQPGPI